MDLGELLAIFQDERKLHHFEGDSGLANLEKVFNAIGYREHGFRFGSTIEVFLADNPGAVQALIEWIGEQNVQEWRECLADELGVEPDAEDEDEDEGADWEEVEDDEEL